MTKPFAILLVGVVLLQSLFGAVAGTLCLGGGHEHPGEAATASCELDCGHASGRTPLPTPVEEVHADCSCVDIDLSMSELLSTAPRVESISFPALLPEFYELTVAVQIDWEPKRFLSPMPSWFDPGGAQRVTHLSTTRLIV